MAVVIIGCVAAVSNSYFKPYLGISGNDDLIDPHSFGVGQLTTNQTSAFLEATLDSIGQLMACDGLVLLRRSCNLWANVMTVDG